MRSNSENGRKARACNHLSLLPAPALPNTLPVDTAASASVSANKEQRRPPRHDAPEVFPRRRSSLPGPDSAMALSLRMACASAASLAVSCGWGAENEAEGGVAAAACYQRQLGLYRLLPCCCRCHTLKRRSVLRFVCGGSGCSVVCGGSGYTSAVCVSRVDRGGCSGGTSPCC